MAIPVIFRDNRDFANATESSTDLLYNVLQSEVLLSYVNNSMLAGMVNRMQVPKGSLRVDVPLLHEIGSEYHEAGEEMLGLDVPVRTRSIYLDDRPRVSHIYLDDIDGVLSNIDARTKLAMRMGTELSQQADKSVWRLLVAASRTTTGSNSDDPFLGGGIDGNGTAKIDANFDDGDADAAQRFLAALDEANLLFAQRNVPMDERYAVIKPDLFFEVAKLETLTSGGTSWGAQIIGNRNYDTKNKQFTEAYSQQEPLFYRGFKIFWSNLLVQDDGSNDHANRNVDTTNSVGVIFQKEAIAFVEKLPLQFEKARVATRGADFMSARTLIGGGTIRPEACIELAVA
ncbi:MAG: hypothetical protein D6698_10140 [Gammaproteobacteria bacterium]|nr:MAG: hypothetical protein D6698_10140 [Gammaproteobacteria bacterium]